MDHKVVALHADQPLAIETNAVSDSTLAVTLTVRQLRELVRGVLIEERQGENRHGEGDRLLNAGEAGAFLGYSRDWVYRHQRAIGGRKLGGGIRFSRRDLEKWVASRKTA